MLIFGHAIVPAMLAHAASPLLALALLLGGHAAHADVRSRQPRKRCEVDGPGCTMCSRHLGGDPLAADDFDKCAAEARGRGLVEVCDHRAGAVRQAFFCPGETRSSGDRTGCASCAVGGDARGEEAAALALMAAGAVVGLWRRRERG